MGLVVLALFIACEFYMQHRGEVRHKKIKPDGSGKINKI
jgi:hypothetical protein